MMRAETRISHSRNFLLFVYAAVLLIACQPDLTGGPATSPTPVTSLDTPMTSPSTVPLLQTTDPNPTTTSHPTPHPVILAVPTQSVGLVARAIDRLNQNGTLWEWQLDAGGDLAEKVALGWADIALLPQGGEIPVGQRPLALAVPFTSEWEFISLEDARQILTQGSPFVAVMDWAEMPHSLKALRVDGLSPGDSLYPIQQSWSLIASPGFETAAASLAVVMAGDLSEDPVVHMAAVGDVMLDRTLGEIIRSGDLTYPFAEVSHLLSSADITIGNLESSLTDLGVPAGKGYTFRAPPEAAQSLALAGFDLLSLANNHALDYGIEALDQGIALLHGQGIATIGAGADVDAAHTPHLKSINGLTIAFLAYVHVPVEVRGFDTQTWSATATRPGLAWADPDQMRMDITAARLQADLVVILLHSGYENVFQPSPPQMTAARAAIDAGAHLVIGHHAHVIQGIEFYKTGVIAYGLGNFAFEDGGSTESVVLNVWLDKQGVRGLELLPTMIESDGHPRPATDEEAVLIRQGIYALTTSVDGP